MHELAPLIGRSPRATKRFVNSYRLLKASLTDGDRQRFQIVEGALGPLAVPLLMLAVVTGVPDVARAFVGTPEAGRGSLGKHLRAVSEDLVGGRYRSVRARIDEFLTGPQTYWRADVAPSDFAVWARRAAQFSFEELR